MPRRYEVCVRQGKRRLPRRVDGGDTTAIGFSLTIRDPDDRDDREAQRHGGRREEEWAANQDTVSRPQFPRLPLNSVPPCLLGRSSTGCQRLYSSQPRAPHVSVIASSNVESTSSHPTRRRDLGS